MAVKPETAFTSSINALLKGKEVYYEKMHNPYRAGTPDYWYSGKSGDLWVEYKFRPSLPARPTTPVPLGLTPRQLDWLAERQAEGRRVAVIFGWGKQAVVLTDKMWLLSFTPNELRARALSRAEVAEWIFHQVGAPPGAA